MHLEAMGTPLSPRAAQTPACASHAPENNLSDKQSSILGLDIRASAPVRLTQILTSAGSAFSPACHSSRLRVVQSCGPSIITNSDSSATLELHTLSAKPAAPNASMFSPSVSSTRQTNILSHNKAIIYHVLRNLGEPFELARAATVSRLWRDVASVPLLWTALLEQEHRAASAPPPTASESTAASSSSVAGAPDSIMPTARDAPGVVPLQEQPSDLPNTNGPRTFQQQVVLEMRKQESLHQQERRLQRQKQQQLLFPMLPSDLLQPSCDNLSTSALQLGRWLGVRRLVSKAARIGHVRGAWGAYVPATGRLVVLDQKEQIVWFVDLDETCGSGGVRSGVSGCGGGGGDGGNIRRRSEGSSGGGGCDGGSASAEPVLDTSLRGGGGGDDAVKAGVVRRKSSGATCGGGGRGESGGDVHEAAVRHTSRQPRQLHLEQPPPPMQSRLACACQAAVHVSVPSPRPASMGTPPGGSNAAAGSGAAGIGQGGGAVAPPPLPPPPPPPPGAADPLPLGVQHQQQEQHPDAPEAGDLLPEERFKLQVVAACGGGLVATGHPDGRVLVWDSARASVAYTLPSLEGCGRGPVVALTADEGLLAVAYRREVLVWDLPPPQPQPQPQPPPQPPQPPQQQQQQPSAEETPPKKGCDGGGGDGSGDSGRAGALGGHCDSVYDCTTKPAVPQAALAALIKPTLGTAVRSLALSARHGVLAMRSWDGVELRATRGGRWLHSLQDRRNTALLAAGGVLFVASSSPSFLGNNFLQFEVEVAAIDLAAVVAAAAAVATAAAAAGAHSAPDDGGGGGGDGGVPDGVVGRTGGAGGELPAGTSATACTAAATAPFVIRTVTPPQQYVLRGAPLSEFKWDQPLQMCLTGGLLLLRCLQFPLAPGKLAWPGLFAFRMGDLVSGLALGRQCSSGGSGPGAPSAAAFPAGTDGLAAAAAAAQPPLLPAPTAVLCRTIQPDVLCGDGGFVATDEEAMFIGEGGSSLRADGRTSCSSNISCSSSHSSYSSHSSRRPDACGSFGSPRKGLMWEERGSGSGSGGGRAGARQSIASMQLIAARHHLVILSDSLEAYAMGVPYSGHARASRRS